MNFCCKQLELHIGNEKFKVIRYKSRTKSFGIKVSTTITQSINYCPWCGVKLPEDLTETLGDIIFDELCLDSFSDDPRMPEEFKTDEWWIKRGL